MVLPRPKTTTTPALEVQSVHNHDWIVFRLRWKDTDKSMAGILGEFSDAVALEFPVIEKEIPPLVFMGSPGDPVHIFHWRAQYQRDKEEGKPDMKQLYPNLNIDTYPMEYPDWGNLPIAGEQARESFSPGKAVGNPQSYEKTGVDEIIAGWFSTRRCGGTIRTPPLERWRVGCCHCAAAQAGRRISPDGGQRFFHRLCRLAGWGRRSRLTQIRHHDVDARLVR
jgi:hypothetical protein